MAWAFYSERDGEAVNVDMLKPARLVEIPWRQMAGMRDEMIQIIDRLVTETKE